MLKQIMGYLNEVSLKNSDKKVRQMVADRFGGILTSRHRYVKIGDEEFRITKNPEAKCGWNVERMSWEHGNDWRFFTQY